jgi:hypothetical protein
LRKSSLFIITSLVIICLTLGNEYLFASSPTIKDINGNYRKYIGKTVLITGEVAAIVDHSPMQLIMVDLNNSGNDSKGAMEINLYIVTAESESIYVVSLKHYEEQQQASFKAKILLTSKDKLASKAVELFDKYIYQKSGISSPELSEQTLQGLIDKLPTETFWVLMIEIE